MYMGFQANVLNVLIASPGDMATERDIVTQELFRWNSANGLARRLLLQPVKWETHASPQMGSHPQHILNERLLTDADIVVGVLGTRIGTATPEFISGSVEEIKRHVAAGKLAMLYFSKVPVDPTTIDQVQWSALLAFKEECRSGGLYAEYESHEQFQSDFSHHLAIELSRPKYMWLEAPMLGVQPAEPVLSVEERKLLLAAADDRNGQILTFTSMGGFSVQANDLNFVENTPRSSAQWKRVLSRLNELGYIDQVNSEVYELTESGFERADKERTLQPISVSLSFDGPANSQILALRSTGLITPKQIDFLTSSDIQISSMPVNMEPGTDLKIPLDHLKIIELFSAPRPDKAAFDHSGPAKLRVVFDIQGRRGEGVLPVLLQPRSINNQRWIHLTGSGTFDF